MRKPDEIALYEALRVTHAYPPDSNRQPADEVAEGLGMHAKRAHAILSKWSGQGWWNYGVSLRTGWFEATAPAVLKTFN